jgi:hypothetical protein
MIKSLYTSLFLLLFILSSCCKETEDYQPLDQELLKWFTQKQNDSIYFTNNLSIDKDTLVVSERSQYDSVANKERCESDLVDILFIAMEHLEDTSRKITFNFKTSDMRVSIPGGYFDWSHQYYTVQATAGMTCKYYRELYLIDKLYDRVLEIEVHNPQSFIKKIYLVFNYGIIRYEKTDGSVYSKL